MKHQTRIILAGTLGNLIESFDMAICGLLSVYIAKYLIGDASKGLFLVFLTFFAGYLARPIGAMTMGLLSDIYGRKIILAGSILSMGVSTTFIGFIPPHSTIGIFSVITLLVLRIIQSFSCGAEYLNSSAYLVENAEASKKGYSGSWASFGAMSGMLVASLVALIVTYFTNHYPEHDWLIWRVPFVLALLGSSIGLYIRLCIPESMEYIIYYADRPKPKFKSLFSESINFIKNNKIQSLYVFVLSCLGVTTTFQIYIYGPMQAHLYGHFQDHEIIMSNIISLIVLLGVFPLIGKLSDKLNREKIVIFASIGFLILSQPFFYALSHHDIYNLLLGQALIAIPAGAYYATVPVMLSEMFPIKLRCTVLSAIYSTAASLSAGLAPLLSFILVKKTHIASSPSILILIFVLLSFLLLSIKHSTLKKQPGNPAIQIT
ncbi:Proline porter II [Legionella pneumophila]|uniref:MFS transporter n=1 Tax=Legionella pneumophila TaxID=446 RepID=UPI0000444C76|nr:MFS transporter [Legionella pneumophila]ERH42148.1 MFS transporter [Legionella pneumophila str. Leg01/11]ERH44641.1 MFS transporter [Legionella pneumophila str. Leg01/53]ERI47400.1 MFS transporter [Legionella pneumophila str. Leg01/20]AEW51309.1 proline/betaine transporter ProP6 [Legionella pneumophila subsp. pneumophila ATCC 43290]ANN95172.1 MFS transporter [Legionella pneumophila]